MAKKQPTEDTEAESQAGAETEGDDASPKRGKKKLLFIVAGAVAVLIVVGVVLMLALGGDKDKALKAPEQTVAAVSAPVYYELPEFLVNLSSTNSRVSFLKMSVTLELRDAAAVAVIEANKPRISDTFITYLRELRPADVQGSAGIYRLRDELMTRLNATIEEGLVKDILFSEIIVQ